MRFQLAVVPLLMGLGAVAASIALTEEKPARLVSGYGKRHSYNSFLHAPSSHNPFPSNLNNLDQAWPATLPLHGHGRFSFVVFSTCQSVPAFFFLQDIESRWSLQPPPHLLPPAQHTQQHIHVDFVRPKSCFFSSEHNVNVGTCRGPGSRTLSCSIHSFSFSFSLCILR